MSEINLFSTKKPVNKTMLLDEVKKVSGSTWSRTIQTVDELEHNVYQAVIPFTVKGIKEPVRVRTYWMEVAPNCLLYYWMDIDYASVSIGETRFNTIQRMVGHFIQPDWFISFKENDPFFVETSHEFRSYDSFKHNRKKDIRSIRYNFLLIHHASSSDIHSLFDLSVPRSYRDSEKIYRHSFVSWDNKIFDRYDYGEETFGWNGTHPTYQSSGEEKSEYYGIYLHERETDSVYQYKCFWDSTTPARFFPLTLSALKSRYILNNHNQSNFLWTELAKAEKLPTNQHEVGSLTEDGFCLKLYSKILFEENDTTFKIGDYVQTDEEKIGVITSDEFMNEGFYHVSLERDRPEETDKYHLSKLVKIKKPKQLHTNKIVISEEGWVGQLITEGFQYSEVNYLTYKKNETGFCIYDWVTKKTKNDSLKLINSEEWEKTFKMLQLETNWRGYFNELANDPTWSFLNQWLDHCGMFEFSNYDFDYAKEEVAFFYFLTTLTRSFNNYLKVQNLILNSSFIQAGYFGCTESGELKFPWRKAKKFVSLVLEDEKFKFAFSSLPIQTVEKD